MVDLHIRLNGYTVECIDKGVSWLLKVADFCGLTMRVSYVPRRYHTISVLQSPHVNKKSWEQFVEITRGRGLMTTCDPQRAQLYLHLLERAHIPGVEVSLCLRIPTAF
nr:RPS10 [Picochlorum sp. 'soloecismus']